MVNALSRDVSQTIWKQSKSINEQLTKILTSVNTQIDNAPCALREFVNSNADLPTIEELVKQSQTLAQIMGMTG